MRFTDSKYGGGYSPRRIIYSLALIAAGMARSQPAHAIAFVPANDDVVLEQLPDARDVESRDLRQKHHQLAADPHNLKLALAVARGDLDRSRALADPRFLGRAEAALAPWPEGPNTPQRCACCAPSPCKATMILPKACVSWAR